MNDILNTLADIQRRLRKLEALGERPTNSTLDGSGTAGQVVTWVTATTLGSSGYAGSAVTRYTGVPTAGRVVTWAGNGTVQDAGFAGSVVPLYTGTPVAGRIASWTGAGTLQASTPGDLALTQYTGTGTAGNVVAWAGNGTAQDSGFASTALVRTGAANTFTLGQTVSYADLSTYSGTGTAHAGMLTLRNTVNEISSSSGVQFRVANEGTVAQQAYVGIVAMYGTPSPKFVVKVNTGTASYAEYLSIAPDGLTTVNALSVGGSLSVGGTIRASDTGGLRVVDSGGTLGVYVKDSGDVGIGTATTASGYRLTVNGKIDATGATLDSADVTGDIRLTGSLAGDVSGTERSWRQTQYYSTNIATGATDTVATFTLPGNAKCGGVVTLAISQDTTAGTQRGHMLHIRLYVETFSSSFGVINSATISSHSATNEPLPTVAFAAGSGTTLNINVTNNGASKVIRNVAVTLDITRAN